MAVTYKDSGVDIDAGNESVRRIKKHLKSTHGKAVISKQGLFGGAFSLNSFSKLKNPALVSTIDGVGTKVKVAAMVNRWDSVGQDLVNHCADDILCLGAKPLFFLDYIAASKLNPETVEQIVKGMSKACRENDCALIGGETAEMPGVYERGEHDIAGCMVGISEEKKLVDGSRIKTGDVVIGLPSNGLHTNGYSLARKVLFEKAGLKPSDFVEELECTIGEELLKVHKSYSKQVLGLMEKSDVCGIAHVTGGGLLENTARILHNNGVEFEKQKINVPPIFRLIQEKGEVPEKDMWRSFNMGIGLVLVVPQAQGDTALKELKKSSEKPVCIGKVVSKKGTIFV
jgi:phosphoribosylformylglycinamidine cyclo-ligase